MFWSSGLDGIIRLWNMDTFSNVYKFTLNEGGSFSQIQIISQTKFIAVHDGVACLGEINNISKLLFSFFGRVVKFDKKYNNQSIFKDPGDIS